MSRSQFGAGLTGEEVSCSGTMEFGSKTRTIHKSSSGFLEDSKFITSPSPGVSRWGSRRLGWELCGRAGWSHGTAAPGEEEEEEKNRKCRVRAATLGPGQRSAAGLAGTDSCPLQGLSTPGCYRGESGVSAPWVLALGLSPMDKGREGQSRPPLLRAMHWLKGSRLQAQGM